MLEAADGTSRRPTMPSSYVSTRNRRSRRWSARRAICCRTDARSHDYKRHGTTTLFAAFEVATGKVTGAHKKRRRRKEFLAFMDEVVATYPKTRLEVILDNLNTHKKNEEWLARHPLVTFHYTPTRASWLNQVEGWFSILQGQSLTGASFTSVEQLKKHIDAFIESYNEDAEPFVWTKSIVHQRRVKGRRLSDL